MPDEPSSGSADQPPAPDPAPTGSGVPPTPESGDPVPAGAPPVGSVPGAGPGDAGPPPGAAPEGGAPFGAAPPGPAPTAPPPTAPPSDGGTPPHAAPNGLGEPPAGPYGSPYAPPGAYPAPGPYGGPHQGPYGAPEHGAPYGGPYGGSPYGGPQHGGPYGAPYGGSPYGGGAQHGVPYGSGPEHGGPYGSGPQQSAPYGGSPYGGAPYGHAPYGNPPYGPGPQPPYPPGWTYAPPRRPRTAEERRRRRRTGLLVGAALLLVAGAGIGIGAWLAPTSPKTVANGLVSQAVSAGTSAGSFRYVELSTDDGVRDDISGDAASSTGQQEISQRGATGIDNFDLRLVGGVVYFRGNRAAVIDQLGVAATRATTYVGRWVSVRKGEKPYKTFADGITTASNLHQIPTTFVPSSSASTAGSTPPATRISGGLSGGKGHTGVGTAALVITTSSSLPRTFSGQAVSDTGARLTLSWKFSRWGEKVHVVAPSGAVAYSSLGLGSGTHHG